MTTSDWGSADIFQTKYPHTFNSLQHLVMAMAKVSKTQGKKVSLAKIKALLLINYLKKS
ncbi:MAG: hypothetical protein U9R57_03235 [Thermodesulfobacteriota bacterium]|nr:hypothetical protein [Thermodesulfobacteriota bacterium]